MFMCIIMGMNIYLTKDNEAFLQKIKPNESMSGIINSLLDDYRLSKDSADSGSTDTPKKNMSAGWKPCKHGSDPQFCRFAKPGKVCK